MFNIVHDKDHRNGSTLTIPLSRADSDTSHGVVVLVKRSGNVPSMVHRIERLDAPPLVVCRVDSLKSLKAPRWITREIFSCKLVGEKFPNLRRMLSYYLESKYLAFFFSDNVELTDFLSLFFRGIGMWESPSSRIRIMDEVHGRSES